MRPLICSLCILFACGGDEDPLLPVLPVGTTTTASYTLDQTCQADNPDHTVGLLFCTPEADGGYTLLAPMVSGTTVLVDIHGWEVHRWESDYAPGEAAYLEEGGYLLRTAEFDGGSTRFDGGGAGGLIEQFDWDGNLVWSFTYADDSVRLHHDVERLPNGNLLMLAWEYLDEDGAVAMGRDPSLVTPDGLWGDHIIEVDPATNAIVWSWRALDHAIQDRDPKAANYGVLADNPGKADLNQVGSFGGLYDWTHINSIDYHPGLDQILLSVHNHDEIWIIDHGIDTETAAGPAGDLLYRWGRPERYGQPGEPILSGQHDAEWIADTLPGAGNILVFNNSTDTGKSEVLEITPPLNKDGTYARKPATAFGPTTPEWSWSDGALFFSWIVSGAQRLPNGNTLVCEGDDGALLEVTPQGDVVWSYISPLTNTGAMTQGDEPGTSETPNALFRADRYFLGEPELGNRILMPVGPIEHPAE